MSKKRSRRRANKTFTSEERENLITEFESSNLSRPKFCQSHGLSYTTFSNWIGAGKKSKSKKSLIQLREVRLPITESSGLEIKLPSGMILNVKGLSVESNLNYVLKLESKLKC